jgi:hypothetical protein
MTVVLLDHPFLPGKRGVCVMPFLTKDGYYKSCGKMSSLHQDDVSKAVDQYLARRVSLRGR